MFNTSGAIPEVGVASAPLRSSHLNSRLNLTQAVSECAEKTPIQLLHEYGMKTGSLPIQAGGECAEKTPIQLLHEYGTKTGSLPTYTMEKAEGEAHLPNFVFSVTVGDVTCKGQGPSKKAAKHQAAEAALCILKSNPEKYLHALRENGEPLESSESCNAVGTLQELALKKGWRRPEYTVCVETGPPHRREFTVTCRMETLVETGTGNSKKMAKRAAAEKIIRKLQTGASPEATWTRPSVRLDCLRNSSGEKMLALRRSPLSAPNVDYVQMMLELSQEQGFEVTYFDIDEMTVSGQYQCLAEMSTEPVVVCHGAGISCSNAHNNAAHNALQYVKMAACVK